MIVSSPIPKPTVKFKKLLNFPHRNPSGVFPFLALFLAFLSFWATHKSLLVSPGVFGGPVVFASEVVVRQDDPSVNVRLAAFSGFAAPRLIANVSAIPQEIVRNGWNWGKLHAHNAVDIAAPCGTPIFSFAEGIVSKVGSPVNWNEGYGGFIEVSHRTSDGYEYVSKYAHTKKNEYVVGRYVMPGDKIALVGDTGNVHGPTGCHVHLEVRGAKNPFVR